MRTATAVAPRKALVSRTMPATPEVDTTTVASGSGLRLPATLFLISLAIPSIIPIGDLRLSASRMILVAMVVPCLAIWMSGRAGRIRAADIAFLVFCFWCFLSILVIHGPTATLQPAGIIFIETMGAYLLARCYVRSADDFLGVVRVLFRIVLVLSPFAVIEAVTGRNLLLELFSAVSATAPDIYMPPRWGMRRVQSVFDHPILFGVFTGSAFALTHFVLGYRRSMSARWLATGLVGMTAFLSLSAGPISAVAAQAMLLFWNGVLSGVEARWRILVSMIVLVVVAVELVASRSLPVLFISYFAFDEESAWVRIAIWEYGSESVLNHPLLGIGFHEWARPPWMTSSIDMFWIIDAVRHGIIAEASLLFAFGSIFLSVALRKGLDDRASSYRTGYLIALTGYFLAGWTVYFWNAAYLLLIFLLGSGVWFLDAGTDAMPGRRQLRRAGAKRIAG